MNDEFFEIDGEVISASNLTISKAKEFADAVENSDYTLFVECRRATSDKEIIVFDAKVQVGQITVHDIKKYERIAVIFEESDTVMPEVLALRRNFPHVPHINLRPEEFPRSLCLTENNYSEVKLRWRGAVFLEEIRDWLALTAKGTLHAEDQPLEPLLVGSEGTLILPTEFFTETADSELLSITIIDTKNRQPVFAAERPETVDENQNSFRFVAVVFQSAPRPHGIIHGAPGNLSQLHEYLGHGNINLLDELRNHLKIWKERYEEKNILEARLVIVVCLPKMRNEGAIPEESELYAFLTVETVKVVGIEIGLWAGSDEYVGFLIPVDTSKRGEKIRLGMLNPISSFSRKMGARQNRLSTTDSRNITAIGLGALGSQVFMNLIRAGQGEWTLIDKDTLFPHNLACHALDGFSVGYPKVHRLAASANKTVDGVSIADSVVADVLNPIESPEILQKIKETYNTAEIILDASASITVARHLVHDIDSSARRISIFLNPEGTDVVMLAEDKKREIPLDSLEMQYYRHLINEDSLEGHLKRNSRRIRYGASCRDVTTTIPQDFVALQAAICSRAIQQLMSTEQASLSIWRTDEEQINVQRYAFPVKDSIIRKIGEWTLCTDTGVIDKAHDERVNKLPNETGGILVGEYDMQRKIVYVADCFRAPPDSKGWPAGFIRGHQGLNLLRKEIKKQTGDQLDSIGEWHSHPPGCSVKPSREDRGFFDWLSNHMEKDGLPPLMLIVGDRGEYAFYLEELNNS